MPAPSPEHAEPVALLLEGRLAGVEDLGGFRLAGQCWVEAEPSGRIDQDGSGLKLSVAGI